MNGDQAAIQLRHTDIYDQNYCNFTSHVTLGVSGTVNVLGQYVLSDPYEVVHLFTKLWPR